MHLIYASNSYQLWRIGIVRSVLMLYILTTHSNHGNFIASLKLVILCLFSRKPDVYFIAVCLPQCFRLYILSPSHHTIIRIPEKIPSSSMALSFRRLRSETPSVRVFLSLVTCRLRARRTRFITGEAVQFGIDLRQATWFPVRPRRKLNFEHICTPRLLTSTYFSSKPYFPILWGR